MTEPVSHEPAFSMCLVIAAIGCKSNDKTHDEPPLAITLPPVESEVVDDVGCKTRGEDVWFELAGSDCTARRVTVA